MLFFTILAIFAVAIMALPVPCAQALADSRKPRGLLHPVLRERLAPTCGGAGTVKAIMDQLWDRKGAMPPADMRLLLLPEQQATFDERIAEELLFYNNPEESTESEGEGPQGGGPLVFLPLLGPDPDLQLLLHRHLRSLWMPRE